MKIPEHIAIIMDGNGRWAEEKGFPRTKGHYEGAKRVDEIVTRCREIGVRYLTLYAFSAENWKRPETEVDILMQLLLHELRTMEGKLIKNNVSLHAQGRIDRLPLTVQKELERVIASTGQNSKMELTLCLSYGGRQEIVDAATKIALKVKSGELDEASLTETTFHDHLYRPTLPDPDLLIRTAGEYRVSGFLLWQIAYSELYVTSTPWPDFKAHNLDEAIKAFEGRERRFGLTSKQLEKEAAL